MDFTLQVRTSKNKNRAMKVVPLLLTFKGVTILSFKFSIHDT